MDEKPKTASKRSVCWPVLHRTLGAELIDLLAVLADVVGTRGRAFAWDRSAPSWTAYDMAAYRLHKAGLIARRRTGGRTPFLALTPAGELRVSILTRPERWWQQKWDGRWHVLKMLATP